MIVRVFSPYGTKRVTIDERESVNSLFDKVKKEFAIDDCKLSRKQSGEESIHRSTKHISAIGLKHGDIVYMQVSQSIRKVTSDMEVDGDIKDKMVTAETLQHQVLLQEDDVDRTLSKMDGRIYRQRNEQYCRHGTSNKCIHCVPLEPYDEEYLEHCDPPIQFISFHAYLRKLSGGQHQGKFTTLENTNCKIKIGCKGHPPWPEGICTKCQPSAITLSVQKYRHVDNIMFENASLMNDFLDFWRRTGNQRIGILFGYYTTFDQAPLGIKAVVTAIYEPAQNSSSKSVELLHLKETSGSTNNSDQRASGFLTGSVLDVAASLGLRPVGWIFTDLISEDAKAGTVRHYRGTIDTYFLTAQECITAAFLQNLFPNVCNLSPEGQFGSKFVTVVVTGDKENRIYFEGYQVSNQCMSLVRDDVLVPTCDAPELGYVRESTSDRYVPDVFCKQKDTYGNSVTMPGRPLPVEFLLVHMTAAFPKDEQFSMGPRSPHLSRFPIEHRDSMRELQDLPGLVKYMGQFKDRTLVEALLSIHLLWFLADYEELKLRQDVLELCAAVRVFVNGKEAPSMGRNRAVDKFVATDGWQHVTQRMANPQGNFSVDRSPSADLCDGGPSGSKVWGCVHCTYHNDYAQSSCQMCGLPR